MDVLVLSSCVGCVGSLGYVCDFEGDLDMIVFIVLCKEF